MFIDLCVCICTDFAAEKSNEASAIWACVECIEFYEGTREMVTKKMQKHICRTIQESSMQNIQAFRKRIDDIIRSKSFPTTSGTPPIPPPPPPPPLLPAQVNSDPKLTFEQLKVLKSKHFQVVECTNESPQAKRTMKRRPSSIANDDVVMELQRVLK